MIVIPIEMWPHGRVTKKYQLGELRIINDGTGTSSRGNYIVQVFGKSKARPARQVAIKDWPRNTRPVHELLLAALIAAGYTSRQQDVPKFPVAKLRLHGSSPPKQSPSDDNLPEVHPWDKTPQR